MPEHKMVLLGKDYVGKTAIAIRFLQGSFFTKYDPTIEESYRKNVQIEGIHYLVEIVDTAGLEKMTAMRDLHLRDSQGFILVYSITSRESFIALADIRKDIEKITNCNDFPCMVVGNKTDLEEKRQVTQQEAADWVAKFPDCIHVEVSAKLGVGVDSIFQQLLPAILRAETRKPAVEEEEEPQTTTPAPQELPPPPSGKKGKSGKEDKDKCVVQ